MVTRSLSFVCFVLLSCLSLTALADEFTASVDRNKIYESETFTLLLEKQSTLKSSLGGLLSFGSSLTGGGPDMSVLAQQFEILDQSQRQNVQQVNGRGTSVTTWSYLLVPRTNGQLTIPAIEHDDLKTQPITIEVLAGKKPRDANQAPEVFIELISDKDSVYVQEQLEVKVLLYAAHQLASGDLSEPVLADAVIEQVGDTEKYFKMAYNRRYEVRERTYVVFPQVSGQNTIDPVRFQGVMLNTNTRQRARVLEVSDSLDITIKPPPASFSGDTWIPAISYKLSESWDVDPEQLVKGDSATRAINSQAIGLMSAALPPIGFDGSEGLKVYPDQPAMDEVIHELGIAASRVDTAALIAVKPGTYTLPAVDVPWWDTVNDVERVASLPERRVVVGAASGGSPSELNTPPTTTPAESDQSIVESPQVVAQNDGAPITSEQSTHQDQTWLIVLMGVGWFVSVVFLLLRNRNTNRQATQGAEEGASDTAVKSKDLLALYTQSHPDIVRQTLIWATAQYNDPAIRTIQALSRYNAELAELLKTFESERSQSQKPSIHKSQFAQALKTNTAKKSSTSQHRLMPFYPS